MTEDFPTQLDQNNPPLLRRKRKWFRLKGKLKWLKPKSLYTRTLILILAPLLLVQAVAAIMFYGQLWELVSRRLCGAVATEIATVSNSYEYLVSQKDKRSLIESAIMASGYRIEYLPNQKLTNINPADDTSKLRLVMHNALQTSLNRPFYFDLWNKTIHMRVEVQLDNGVIVFSVPRELIYTSAPYVLFLWMSGTSMIFLLVSLAFLRTQMRPIKRLAEAARAFGQGHNDPQLTPSGASEIRLATDAFIAMRGQIRRFLSQRTNMLSAASHDLRSPLTRMKLELELLELKNSNDLEQQKAFEGLRYDIGEMEHLIDSYMAFLRNDEEEAAREINLAELLTELTESAKRNRLVCDFITPLPCLVTVRVNAMKRVFDNLISNAARHAKKLQISTETVENWLFVRFDDDGPGIPSDKRELAMTPFVRLEESRNSRTGGYGLGLSLARDVVLTHNGEIILLDSPLGGLRVEIKLPQ